MNQPSYNLSVSQPAPKLSAGSQIPSSSLNLPISPLAFVFNQLGQPVGFVSVGLTSSGIVPVGQVAVFNNSQGNSFPGVTLNSHSATQIQGNILSSGNSQPLQTLLDTQKGVTSERPPFTNVGNSIPSTEATFLSPQQQKVSSLLDLLIQSAEKLTPETQRNQGDSWLTPSRFLSPDILASIPQTLLKGKVQITEQGNKDFQRLPEEWTPVTPVKSVESKKQEQQQKNSLLAELCSDLGLELPPSIGTAEGMQNYNGSEEGENALPVKSLEASLNSVSLCDLMDMGENDPEKQNKERPLSDDFGACGAFGVPENIPPAQDQQIFQHDQGEQTEDPWYFNLDLDLGEFGENKQQNVPDFNTNNAEDDDFQALLSSLGSLNSSQEQDAANMVQAPETVSVIDLDSPEIAVIPTINPIKKRKVEKAKTKLPPKKSQTDQAKAARTRRTMMKDSLTRISELLPFLRKNMKGDAPVECPIKMDTNGLLSEVMMHAMRLKNEANVLIHGAPGNRNEGIPQKLREISVTLAEDLEVQRYRSWAEKAASRARRKAIRSHQRALVKCKKRKEPEEDYEESKTQKDEDDAENKSPKTPVSPVKKISWESLGLTLVRLPTSRKAVDSLCEKIMLLGEKLTKNSSERS